MRLAEEIQQLKDNLAETSGKSSKKDEIIKNLKNVIKE